MILYLASAVEEDGGVEPRVPLPLPCPFFERPFLPVRLGDGGWVAPAPGLLPHQVPAAWSHCLGMQVPPGALW